MFGLQAAEVGGRRMVPIWVAVIAAFAGFGIGVMVSGFFQRGQQPHQNESAKEERPQQQRSAEEIEESRKRAIEKMTGVGRRKF